VSPVARNYKEGSVLYFENDKSDEIYILKSGRVVLLSSAIDSGEEIKEEIKTGEFFGIRSVLGNYKREETAQVVSQSLVLVFSQDEFEKLIAKNFDILMKLLKVFSNQLRRIGKKVRELLQKGESRMPSTELYNIGEYYYRRGKKEQGLYAYRKYIEFYPTGEFYNKAKEKISMINSGVMPSRIEEPAPAPSRGSAAASAPASSPMDDMGPSSPLAEMDLDQPPAMDDLPDSPMMNESTAPSMDFSSPLEGLDDLGQEVAEQWKEPPKRVAIANQAAAPAASAAAGQPKQEFKVKGVEISKKYFDGLSMFSQEKFEDAIRLFDEVLAEKTLTSDADIKFLEKSAFEKGRCLMKLERFPDAITELTNLVKKYQKSDNIKEALFLIGDCYEKTNNPQKAVNFYQKVIGMPPRESINNKAKQKLESLKDKL
jgi:tetratricopeptide (TPR) repeat protein